MSKPKVQVHVYHNQDYKGKYQSIVEAANRAGVTPSTVRQILLGNQECTRQGFVFTYNQLTDEEREELPIRDTLPTKDGFIRHDGRSCRKLVEDAVYEVNCYDGHVTYLGKTKEAKIEQFKNFLFTKFHDRWMIIPKGVATLERQYIREFLNSI